MSGLIAFRGLTLDDVSTGIYFELTRGFLDPPAVRGTDYTVAAKAGRFTGNRIADVNTIILDGYVLGDTEADFLANRQLLYAVLAESGVVPGTLSVTGPKLGLALGTVATIDARVRNWIPGKVIALATQAFSIELESVDPDWVISGSGS